MPMKKQPEGVRRVAREAGEKPPQSYNLYLGKDPHAEFLGWSERLPKGSWQAHPARDDGTEIPPFKDHTSLVEFLLGVHRGLAKTSDASSAEEGGSVEETAGLELTPGEVEQVEAALAEPTQAEADHETAEADHETAVEDHGTAVGDQQDAGQQAHAKRNREAAIAGDMFYPQEQHVIAPMYQEPEGLHPYPPHQEGPAPEAAPAGPDVPFSHAAPPDEPWEYPAPEGTDEVADTPWAISPDEGDMS